MSNNNLRQWSARLETGEQDDELLALAARLERAGRNEPSTIPLDYRRQLRRDLLARYPAAEVAGRHWQLVRTAVAVGGLSLIVILTWLTMSSLQRPSFGGMLVATQVATLPGAAADPHNVYLNHALSGGVLIENVITAGGDTEPQAFLRPGVDLAFDVNWSLGPDTPPLTAFAHLLDETGAIVAQNDAPLTAGDTAASQQFTSHFQLPIPEALPPGRYQLITGLYDQANGSRVSVIGPDGETTYLALGEYELPFSDSAPFRLQLKDGDALDVRAATPSAGTVLSGSVPLHFTITLDHALSSLTQAILEVRVVAIEGENGRGVGQATVELGSSGVDRSTVEVTVNTEELPGPTELGLWLQLRPDAESPPILIEMPEAYRWRYVP